MTVIDVHAHHVPAELLEEVERSGAEYGVRLDRKEAGYGRLVLADGEPLRPFFPELCELELRLPVMERVGVDVQVLSTWTDIAGLDLPPRLGVGWARLQNELLSASAARHPGRFEAMGTLPLQSVPDSVKELEYAVESLGMRSFEICTSVDGIHVGEEEFRPLWAKVAELGVFVLLHPPICPIGTEQLGAYFLKNLIGNPTDTTVAAAKLVLSGIMRDHPGLKVCLAHGGGFLPYQFGRLDQGHRVHPDARSRLPDHRPSSFLGHFYYDTIVYDPRVLSYLVGIVSAERLMLGTDYPFEMFDVQAKARLADAGLEEEEVQAILGGNAERALRRG